MYDVTTQRRRDAAPGASRNLTMTSRHVLPIFARTKRTQRALLNRGGTRTGGGPADHPRSLRAGWRAAHGALEIPVTSYYSHEIISRRRHAIPVFETRVRPNLLMDPRNARPIWRPSCRRSPGPSMLALRAVVLEIYRHFFVFVDVLPGNFIEFSTPPF